MELQEIKGLIQLINSDDEVNKMLTYELVKSMKKGDWNLLIRYIINSQISNNKLNIGCVFNKRLGRISYLTINIEKMPENIFRIKTTLFTNPFYKSCKILINNDLVYKKELCNLMNCKLQMKYFNTKIK